MACIHDIELKKTRCGGGSEPHPGDRPPLVHARSLKTSSLEASSDIDGCCRDFSRISYNSLCSGKERCGRNPLSSADLGFPLIRRQEPGRELQVGGRRGEGLVRNEAPSARATAGPCGARGCALSLLRGALPGPLCPILVISSAAPTIEASAPAPRRDEEARKLGRKEVNFPRDGETRGAINQ